MKYPTLLIPSAVMSLAGVALTCGLSAAPAAKSYGTVKPYSLTATALKDVTGKTDLTLTVNVVAPGYSAPSSSSHIQLKSLDTAGTVRWTKNTQDVALAVSGSSSTYAQSFTDVTRYQPIQASVQVQNSQTVNKENLDATTTVKLRPDIVIESISAPERIVAGQVVNLAAAVRELNGDLGATTRVRLSEGTSVLDTVASVSVNAAGSTSAVFATKFMTAGRHTLTVTADNVNPGDYNPSNNSRTVTIEVVNSLQPVTFVAGYWANLDRDYYYESYNWYGLWKQSVRGSEESYWLELHGVPMGAIDKLSVDFGGDGVLNPSLHLERTNLGANTWGWGIQLDNNTWFYSQYDYWSGSYDQQMVQISRYAGDRVYYSEWHDYYWGGNGSQTDVRTDTLLRPNATFDARVVLTVNGSQYGGSLSVPLYRAQYSYTWDSANDWYWQYYYGYYGSGYYYFGRDNYTYVNGYTQGVTTP